MVKEVEICLRFAHIIVLGDCLRPGERMPDWGITSSTVVEMTTAGCPRKRKRPTTKPKHNKTTSVLVCGLYGKLNDYTSAGQYIKMIGGRSAVSCDVMGRESLHFLQVGVSLGVFDGHLMCSNGCECVWGDNVSVC